MSGTECGWKAMDPSLCFPSDFIWSFKYPTRAGSSPCLTPVGTTKPFGSGLECWGRCFSLFFHKDDVGSRALGCQPQHWH